MLNPFVVGLVAIMTASAAIAESDGDTRALSQRLTDALGESPDALRAAPVPGLYEATFGTVVVYFSADGKYMLRGELLDLESRTNLTEQRMATLRHQQLEDMDRSSVISFVAPEEKHRIEVFTDIDCGYCRKLHNEINDYLQRGISVDYLAYPRAGIGSESYRKAVNVWCSDDRQEALTRAKAGKRVEAAGCEAPVSTHMALGERLGVNGTPALFLEDGSKIGGYVPADRLEQMLDERFP